jgi:hypothetical protein
LKAGLSAGFSTEHVPGGAGVHVTILAASNVGVLVGGRAVGVRVQVGARRHGVNVPVGRTVFVKEEVGDELFGVSTSAAAHAERTIRKITNRLCRLSILLSLMESR